MNGAIIFSGTYGSTEQYANWISEATGLTVFDIMDSNADSSKYDYLILGSSIIYMKLSMRKWAKANLSTLKGRSKILFSVSGAEPSDKLERWVANSFPSVLLSQMKHVALAGRLDHSKVSWFTRTMLFIGSLINPDPAASEEERQGFDHVDKDSIQPILELVAQYQSNTVSS